MLLATLMINRCERTSDIGLHFIMGKSTVLQFFMYLMITSPLVPAQNENSRLLILDAFSKTINFGGCPKVPSMDNFDVTLAYGKWYIVAELGGEPLVTPQHCTSVTLGDSNPGSDICRVDYVRETIHYGDDKVLSSRFTTLLVDTSNPGEWVMNFRK